MTFSDSLEKKAKTFNRRVKILCAVMAFCFNFAKLVSVMSAKSLCSETEPVRIELRCKKRLTVIFQLLATELSAACLVLSVKSVTKLLFSPNKVIVT